MAKIIGKLTEKELKGRIERLVDYRERCKLKYGGNEFAAQQAKVLGTYRRRLKKLTLMKGKGNGKEKKCRKTTTN